MGEKDDHVFGFGLSLSLSLGGCEMNQSPPPPLKVNSNKSSWNPLFQLQDRSSDTRLFLGGTDVSSAPTAADCDDGYNRDSSPNSAVSSVSGKRSEREEENAAAAAVELASCSRGSEDEDGFGGDGDGARKKLRLTKEQSMLLEETFKEHNTLNPKHKQALAKELNLRPRQVEVWFQNRRARTKLKQTEVDCEYLKRCCENLTEENRRLQKEVQELRALKLSPNLFMHMNPPTTLTMCPACERVPVSSTSSSSAAVAVQPSNCNPFGPNIWRPGPISRPSAHSWL